MDESGSWYYLDHTTESARDEAVWDEIVNADFSDDGCDLSISPPEDDDLVILPAAPQKPSSPPCRTVWEILSERLAKTSFEARFVDAEQRRVNEASIKRRYQRDPTKRRTWTSRCGRHQVVGYFNFYMHTQEIVGLMTEEGFPVQVKLSELSAEDVRFVVTKLGHSLRGKVEMQLSAQQTVKQVEGSKGIKGKGYQNDRHRLRAQQSNSAQTKVLSPLQGDVSQQAALVSDEKNLSNAVK